MSFILLPIANIVLAAGLAPLLVGVIRKCKAFFQNRRGASILQPYRDLRKLFAKSEVISADASWVFRYAPHIVFSGTALAAGGLPIFALGHTGTLGNIFIFVYLLALSTFFLALAGMDAGSSFGGFGSSREMSLAAIVEAALVFSLIPLALAAHSQNFGEIASVLSGLPFEDLLPVFVAFLAFVVALLAETGRVPVDNPATHLELTMIHEAMILEYSGKRLALMEWAAAMKLFIFVALGALLFFPSAALFSATEGAAASAFSFLIFLAKCACFALGIALVESAIAKLRIFRVPSFIFTSFVLGAVGIALTAI